MNRHFETGLLMECEFEVDGIRCSEQAVQMACGKGGWINNGHPNPGIYCKVHAELVADEGCPEYTDTCPNCGCMFGVN
jgi:hypothetical protein